MLRSFFSGKQRVRCVSLILPKGKSTNSSEMRFQAAVVGFDSQPVSEDTVVKRYITAAAKKTCFAFLTAGFISWDMTVPCPAALRRRNVRRTFTFRHNHQRHIRQFVQKHLKLSAVRINAGSTPALAWRVPTDRGALQNPAESGCSILIPRGFFTGKLLFEANNDKPAVCTQEPVRALTGRVEKVISV